MELSVKNRSGDVVDTVAVSERVFAAASNDALLHQVVTAQLANRRQGNHESQTRGQVSYSTRKLRAQKHSGAARLGSRKSPTMVGGGTIFGPHKRSYRKRVNKKMRRQALRIALSEKVRADRITIVDEFDLDAPRTKSVVELMDAIGTHGRTLLVVAEHDRNVLLSARGAERVDVTFADGLDATTAASVANIVATRAAIDRIDAAWGDGSAGAAAAIAADDGSDDAGDIEVGDADAAVEEAR